MKAIVCFKTMADTAMLAASDWVADDRLRVDVGFVRQIFNCYDESALELALRLAEQTADRAESTELTALTVDDHRADVFLRHLYAVGYHRAVRLEPGAEVDPRFNPRHVSRLIAAQVEQIGGAEVILTGLRSGEGDTGQTGPLIAERLTWPCLTNVIDLRAGDRADHLVVTSLQDGREVVQTVRPPVVLTVGNATEAPYLRQPSLRRRMETAKSPIELKSPAELGLDPAEAEADNRLVGLTGRRTGRTCEMIQGRTIEEQVRQLYEVHLAGRLPK